MNDMSFSDLILAADGEYDEVIRTAQRENGREENIALKYLVKSFAAKAKSAKRQ